MSDPVNSLETSSPQEINKENKTRIKNFLNIMVSQKRFSFYHAIFIDIILK